MLLPSDPALGLLPSIALSSGTDDESLTRWDNNVNLFLAEKFSKIKFKKFEIEEKINLLFFYQQARN